MPDCVFVFSDIIWLRWMFYKKHAVKRTIWNILICLDNWKLGCPCCGLLSAQTQQLWGSRKLFWCYKAGISVLLWRYTWEIRQCSVLPPFQFPRALFFRPPPFPFWLLFHTLFQPKQGFYFTPSLSPLFCCCFSPPALTMWALRPKWQPKLTQSTVSQVSLSYALSSRSR